jgi:ankyrin repeat protein
VQDSTTPLMFAASCGMIGVMKALVRKGAQLHTRDTRGRTALLNAMVHQQEEAALWLVE